jgi:hypothetical protein
MVAARHLSKRKYDATWRPIVKMSRPTKQRARPIRITTCGYHEWAQRKGFVRLVKIRMYFINILGRSAAEVNTLPEITSRWMRANQIST